MSELAFGGITSLAYKTETLDGAHVGIDLRAIDFGIVFADSATATRTLALRSVGTDTLIVNDLAVDDSTFGLSADSLPASLPPGESITFQLSFTPRTAGPDSSTLVVTTNDLDTPERSVTLFGEGLILARAKFGVCYGATDGFAANPGELITIDQSTGAGSVIGPTGLNSIDGLAINSSGVILGAEVNGQVLYYIDEESGNAFFASETQRRWDALAFDRDDVLYGISSSSLYTIEPTTGEIDFIATVPRFSGIAFDPIDGTLWGVGTREVYIVDKTSGQSNHVGNTGLNGAMTDIHFDADGNLYGSLDGSGSDYFLVSLDKETGAGSVIGEIGISRVRGLATRFQRLQGRHIARSRSIIAFGEVLLEFGATRAVTLQSIGTDTVTIQSVSIPQGRFSLADTLALPLAFAPGQSLQLRVRFSPTDTMLVEEVLTVESDDADTPSRTVWLRGRGFRINFAEPLTMYASTGVRGNNPGSLISINPENGAGTFVASTELNRIPGLAIDSNGIIVGSNGQDLYYIDALTGKTVLALATNLDRLDAVAFDSTDVLYAIDDDRDIYEIKLQLGQFQKLSRIDRDLQGLAFAQNGELWGSSSRNIYRLNIHNGQTALVGNTGLNERIPDITFDDLGRLFGAVGGGIDVDNFLIEINQNTGQGVLVGEIGFRAVSGLAFAPRRPDEPTHVDDSVSHQLPKKFALEQNYPNPFNPSTQIRFAIAKSGPVTLRIFNIRGQMVKTLLDEEKEPDFYELSWDGTDDNGIRQASGVYILHLKTETAVLSRRMTLLK